MVKFFGKLFERRVQIEVDLGRHTLEDIMKFPKAKDVALGEYCISNIENKNHITTTEAVRKEDRIIHTYQYFPEYELIIIDSKFQHPYLIFMRVLIFIIPIFFIGFENIQPAYFFIPLGFFVFLFLIHLGSISSGAGEAKRELIIRINYLRRNGVV